MWKVYAKRVCGLVFLSDLWRTEPWIKTKSPERKWQHIKFGLLIPPQASLRCSTYLENKPRGYILPQVSEECLLAGSTPRNPYRH